MSVQFSLFSHVRLFATTWTAAHQASLSITKSTSLLTLMSSEAVMPNNHLTLCHPHHLRLSILPSIRVFFNESVLHFRCPKYWSFSFSTSPSNKYSGLTSFRIDWFDLLAVQGTLKSHQGIPYLIVIRHKTDDVWCICWCSQRIESLT